MDANSDKVKKAVSMLDKAEALHKEGKHADSVKQANEASICSREEVAVSGGVRALRPAPPLCCSCQLTM